MGKNYIINPKLCLNHLHQLQLKTAADNINWRHGRQIIIEKKNFKPAKSSLPIKEDKFKGCTLVTNEEDLIVGIGSLIKENVLQPKAVFNAIDQNI